MCDDWLFEALFRATAASASYAVVTVAPSDALSLAGHVTPYAVVLAGLAAGGGGLGTDAEMGLAHVAQLVVRGPPPRALVIAREDAESELIADVSPPQTQILRGLPALLGLSLG